MTFSQMSVEPDYRDYVNPHPRYSERAQKAALGGLGTTYVEDKSGKVIDRLLASVRPGSIVRVLRPFLLAPVKGQTRRRRRLWAERLNLIKESGGKLECLEPPNCVGAKMGMVAYEEIAASGRGRFGIHRLGRPKLEIPPERLQAMTAIWCSREYKTRAKAVEALKLAGYDVSIDYCYRHLGMPTAPKFKPGIAPTEKKPRKKLCFVYFIREGQMVKIGRSTDPSARLRDLSVSNHRQLEMLATIPGDNKREKALHRRFAKHHIRGEWFHLSGPILKYITEFKRKRRKVK